MLLLLWPAITPTAPVVIEARVVSLAVRAGHVAARVDAPTLTATTVVPVLHIDTDAGTVRRPLTHAGTLRRLDA